MTDNSLISNLSKTNRVSNFTTLDKDCINRKVKILLYTVIVLFPLIITRIFFTTFPE